MFVCWERKVHRLDARASGPEPVGPLGLLQPFADVLKLMLKEVILPAAANKGLFFLAPMMTMVPALAAWAVIPFSDGGARQRQRRPAVPDGDHLARRLRHHHRRLGVELEVRVPGRDARGGADGLLRDRDGLRASSCVLMVSGSLNLTDIVDAQSAAFATGPELPVVELAAAAADVRRLLHLGPGRNQPRTRSTWSKANRKSSPASHGRILGHGVRDVLPGRIRQHDPDLVAGRDHVPGRLAARRSDAWRLHRTGGFIWLFAKVFFVLSVFLWVRATFPRYRYDQIMRLGWKVFIPVPSSGWSLPAA